MYRRLYPQKRPLIVLSISQVMVLLVQTRTTVTFRWRKRGDVEDFGKEIEGRAKGYGKNESVPGPRGLHLGNGKFFYQNPPYSCTVPSQTGNPEQLYIPYLIATLCMLEPLLIVIVLQ